MKELTLQEHAEKYLQSLIKIEKDLRQKGQEPDDRLVDALVSAKEAVDYYNSCTC